MINLIPKKKQWQNWTLPSKISYISFWLGVLSLAITVFISIMNVVIFKKIDDKADYIAVSKLQSVISNLDKTKYLGNDFDYWPDCGLRNAYFHIISLINLNEINEIFKNEIFISGPHSKNSLNLNSLYDFGHYNPTFLKAVKINLDATLEDHDFIKRTKFLYDKYISKIALNYSYAYLFLEKDKELKNTLLSEYKQYIQDKILPDTYIQQTTFVDSWDQNLTSEEILNKLKALGGDSLDLTSMLPVVIGAQEIAHDKRHILSRNKRIRTKLQIFMKNGDSNILAPALYFWLRRAIDGTEKEIYVLLKTLLNKYDPSSFYNLKYLIFHSDTTKNGTDL